LAKALTATRDMKHVQKGSHELNVPHTHAVRLKVRINSRICSEPKVEARSQSEREKALV
jgi:hypothetical protein